MPGTLRFAVVAATMAALAACPLPRVAASPCVSNADCPPGHLCDGQFAFCFLAEPASSDAATHGRDAGSPADAATSGDAAGVEDAASMTWGQHTAQLALPDCPATENPELVVDTAENLLDSDTTLTSREQAGPELSWVEALWIAANRPGLDIIRFDPLVFPAETPQIILLDLTPEHPVQREPVCIDGRGRGVVLDWTEQARQQYVSSVVPKLPPGSLLVGMTLLSLPWEVAIYGSQVAGCRLATDGTMVFATGRPWTLSAGYGAVVGPSNVISGRTALRTTDDDLAATAARVFDNDFGWDPVTGRSISPQKAIDVRFPLSIDRNTIIATASLIDWATLGGYEGVVSLEGNFFGVNRQLEPVGDPSVGLVLSGSNRYVVGPDNVFRHLDVAITVQTASPVTISRNDISRNGSGLVFASGTPPASPTITAATRAGVAGTCAEPGLVELFWDPEDQGERFLGDFQCETTWELAVEVPAGGNVTATLTDGAGATSLFSAPFAVP